MPPPSQWPRILRFMLPWTLHLLLADLLLSALLPLSALDPTLAYRLASLIARSVWKSIQDVFEKHNNANIVLAGDDITDVGSAVVVANHVEWCDFYMIQHLALAAGQLQSCRWFAKQQLKWVPFLGWGLWAMGMPLVSRKWADDKREMDRVFHGVLTRSWPIWLIAYSESTRYTPEKYAETLQWCKEHGKPIPKHTLYPRTKGFVATVQTLKRTRHVKTVLDVTIAYAKGNKFMSPPSFLDTVGDAHLDKTWKFHVHVKKHDLADLPDSPAEIAQWLEDRWIEKGHLLDSIKTQLTQP